MATVDRLELFYSFEWRLCMNEEIKIASHLLCHDICLLSLKLPKVKKKVYQMLFSKIQTCSLDQKPFRGRKSI